MGVMMMNTRKTTRGLRFAVAVAALIVLCGCTISVAAPVHVLTLSQEEPAGESGGDPLNPAANSELPADGSAAATPVRPQCRWCRALVKKALPRNLKGNLDLRCNEEAAEGLAHMCEGFLEENDVRLDFAVGPTAICVDLGACTPSENNESAKMEAEWERELERKNSMLQVLSGHVSFASAQPTFAHMKNGFGDRSFRQRLQFQRPFEREPMVHLGGSGMDFVENSPMRFRASVERIDKYGFDVLITTWADTKIELLRLSWVAYSKTYDERGQMASGKFSVGNARELTKEIKFDTAFIQYPTVLLSISGVETAGGNQVGIVTKLLEVSRDGFTVQFTASGAGVNFADLEWLATSTASRATAGHITLDKTIPGFEIMDTRADSNEFEINVPLNRGRVRICNGVEKDDLIRAIQGNPATENAPPALETIALDVLTAESTGVDPEARKEIVEQDKIAAAKEKEEKEEEGECFYEDVPEYKFGEEPNVVVLVSGFELADGSSPHFEVEVSDVTLTHFKLRVFTTRKTEISRISVGFIAAEMPLFVGGLIKTLGEIKLIGALNNFDTMSRSCRQVVERGENVGDGNYWVRLPGHQGASVVFCDNETGGWMRVVNIVKDSDFHGDRAPAFAMDKITDPDVPAKLGDGDISALNTVGYYRIMCGSYTAFVRTDAGGFTSLRNNGMTWQIARESQSSEEMEFTCEANSPGNVFSEQKDTQEFCNPGFVKYVAATKDEGLGCYHDGEGWGQSGSLWAS